MRWNRPHRDEIDALLGDASGAADLAELAAAVHDLRSAYLSDAPLARGEALTAFTSQVPDGASAPLAVGAGSAAGSAEQARLRTPTPPRRRAGTAVGAVLASLTGKIVLGTAVAAASIGGLQAAHVVDVPGLPDPASDKAVETKADSEGAGSGSTTTRGAGGESTTTEAASPAAAAYGQAVSAWNACAVDARADDRDPVDECGERPQRSDFDDPADDQAPAQRGGPPSTTPATPPPQGQGNPDPGSGNPGNGNPGANNGGTNNGSNGNGGTNNGSNGNGGTNNGANGGGPPASTPAATAPSTVPDTPANQGPNTPTPGNTAPGNTDRGANGTQGRP